MARVTISEALGRHFLRAWRWGEADCCTAACNAFRDLWGVDPMRPIRGRYESGAEAQALIAEFGGLRRLAILLAAEHDLAGRWHNLARPGDIVLLETGAGPGLGLALGEGRFAVKSRAGFVVKAKADYAWGLR